MARVQPGTGLKRELGLWDVYAIATGATLSSGFFLLPGLAAVGAGSALPFAYLLAGLLLLPGLVSKAELATAMPKAGGIYYFLDRSMGPLFGTMGGLGTWIALVLKSAFALVGIGAYLGLFFPNLPMEPVAAGFALFFGIVNLFGAKKSSTFQVYLLIGLMLLLAWFLGFGMFRVDAGYLSDMFQHEPASVITTAGLVVVSYMGLTKVASVAEEVKDPERNLPLGMFLAFITAIVVYSVGTTIMVGVVGADVLAGGGGEPDLTPVATVAEVIGGRTGSIVMTVAAVLAFASVANAGILSASRYPLAMSRDRLIPDFFKKVGSRGTPPVAIAVTVGMIVLFVTIFDPTHIAELASSFQLVTFALACVAVIVMRESGIDSYDPGYRGPFYPWVHILGILAPFWLIVQMGLLPTLFTGGLMIFGAMWFNSYARDRVVREGAILHVFERLGRRKDSELDSELRDIIKEKGLREADPFDEVVAAAHVVEAVAGETFTEVSWRAADLLAEQLGVSADQLAEGFFDQTTLTLMAASRGVVVPHVRLAGIEHARMVLARSAEGLEVYGGDGPEDTASDTPAPLAKGVFYLVSPDNDPGQHLRFLAQLAGRVDDPTFMEDWLGARDPQVLKEILLRDERMMAVRVSADERSGALIGQALRDLVMPEGTLIALIRREGQVLVPRGGTVLQSGDRLTLIGDPPGIKELRVRFGSHV